MKQWCVITAEVKPSAISVYSVVKETCKIDWEENQADSDLTLSGTPLSLITLAVEDHVMRSQMLN